MATSVSLLILDPDTQLHRVIAIGEQAVDASGNPFNTLEAILTVNNDAAALQIRSLADPTLDQDAATKIYVDASILEDFPTSEMTTSKVLQPDGAGSVQWNDFTTDVEGLTTAETNTGKVLQPDGIGGLNWTAFDPVIEGDLDMGCNDLFFVDTIYFCEEGSSSSSSAVDDTPTGVWIAPDRTKHRGLVYHAPDGHTFESPVTFTGAVSLGANSLGNDSPTMTFAAGANAATSIAGDLFFTKTDADSYIATDAAEIILNALSYVSFKVNGNYMAYWTDSGLVMTNGVWIGIESNQGRIVFTDSAPDSIDIENANFYVKGNAIGNNGAVLTFASGATGQATFTGGVAVGGNIVLGANYIGRDSPALSFAATTGNATFAGAVNAPAGTASSPSYRFGGVPDVGLFLIGTSGVGIAAFGNEVCRFVDSTGSAPVITSNNAPFYMGTGGIGRDASVLTFATGASGAATFTGNIIMGDGKYIGFGDGMGRLIFADDTVGSVTLADLNLYTGSFGIGRDAAVLTFATGATGLATFGGGVDVAGIIYARNTSTGIDFGSGSGTIWGATGSLHISANQILVTGDILMGSGGIGNNDRVLTFATGATGKASFTGDVGIPAGKLLDFGASGDISATGGTLTISSGDVIISSPSVTLPTIALGGNYIGNNSNALSFAANTGNATFAAGLAVGGVIDMNANQINELADPTLDQDAATKFYVDTEINAAFDDATAFGQMFDAGNVSSTLDLPSSGVWYKVRTFTSSDNLRDVTADTVNDQHVVDEAGTYLVLLSISFSGSGTTEFSGSIHVNGTPTDHIHFTRKLGTGGDIGSTGAHGLLFLEVGDAVDFRMSADGDSKSVMIEDINLVVIKLDLLRGSSSSSTG